MTAQTVNYRVRVKVGPWSGELGRIIERGGEVHDGKRVVKVSPEWCRVQLEDHYDEKLKRKVIGVWHESQLERA